MKIRYKEGIKNYSVAVADSELGGMIDNDYVSFKIKNPINVEIGTMKLWRILISDFIEDMKSGEVVGDDFWAWINFLNIKNHFFSVYSIYRKKTGYKNRPVANFKKEIMVDEKYKPVIRLERGLVLR